MSQSDSITNFRNIEKVANGGFQKILQLRKLTDAALLISNARQLNSIQITLITIVTKLIKRQSCHHIETSQLIYKANQLTGFYFNGNFDVQ